MTLQILPCLRVEQENTAHDVQRHGTHRPALGVYERHDRLAPRRLGPLGIYAQYAPDHRAIVIAYKPPP